MLIGPFSDQNFKSSTLKCMQTLQMPLVAPLHALKEGGRDQTKKKKRKEKDEEEGPQWAIRISRPEYQKA